MRFFVLCESTRYSALASLLVEKLLSFMNSSVTYVAGGWSPRLPRIDVMSSVAYLTAPERVKPMNPNDVVQAIRYYAIAYNDEARDSSAAKINTAKGLKTSFFDALNDENGKHIMDNTCSIQDGYVLLVYTQDFESGSAVDELLSSAEHLCGNVSKMFEPCSQMQGKLFVLLLDTWNTVNPFQDKGSGGRYYVFETSTSNFQVTGEASGERRFGAVRANGCCDTVS